jgi:hypothetical protein
LYATENDHSQGHVWYGHSPIKNEI